VRLQDKSCERSSPRTRRQQATEAVAPELRCGKIYLGRGEEIRAERKISLASSSIERPWWAARTRNRVFVFSSSCRMVNVAMLSTLSLLAMNAKWLACRLAALAVLFQLLASGWRGNAQEDQNRAVQPHHILVSEAADTRADLRLWNGRDPIHHQSADGAQIVTLARLDVQSKQRSVSRVLAVRRCPCRPDTRARDRSAAGRRSRTRMAGRRRCG